MRCCDVVTTWTSNPFTFGHVNHASWPLLLAPVGVEACEQRCMESLRQLCTATVTQQLTCLVVCNTWNHKGGLLETNLEWLEKKQTHVNTQVPGHLLGNTVPPTPWPDLMNILQHCLDAINLLFMPWSVTGGYGWIAVLLGRQAALERIERHQNSKHRPIIANYSSCDKPMNTKQSVYLFYRPSVTTAMTLMNSSCKHQRVTSASWPGIVPEEMFWMANLIHVMSGPAKYLGGQGTTQIVPMVQWRHLASSKMSCYLEGWSLKN